MATKASVNKKLFSVTGFRKLEEEDSGGEIVDVGDAKADKSF